MFGGSATFPASFILEDSSPRGFDFRGAPSAENDPAEDPTDVDGEGVIAGKVIGVKELLL